MSNAKTLIGRMAEKFGVDARQFYETLKATAFKQKDGQTPTDEQMMALLVVADQFGLNPFTKEIYAYPDKGGIIPVVGVDGWSRIINGHSSCDGVTFEYASEMVRPEGSQVQCPEWIECVLYRKDRSHPIRVREYLDETYRAPFQGNKNGRQFTVNGPWQSHPKRMLRHKAMIQAARIGFGFSGIYDLDEAERIASSSTEVVVPAAVAPEQPAKPTPSQQATAQLTHAQIDPLLNQLASRAAKANAWAAAQEYVEGRFAGENLRYAKDFLREQEALEAEAKQVQVIEQRIEQPQAGQELSQHHQDDLLADQNEGQFF